MKRLCAHRGVAYPLIALVCLGMAFSLGKDVNWDQLAHHYYLGFSAVNDRFALDFLPSSVQSYFVPYAYVPFYWMVSAGWNDKVIVLGLAALAVPGVLAVWELGGRLSAHARNEAELFLAVPAWISVLLVLAAPVFFVQLGSSFVDATVAGLVLWGYVLLVPAGRPLSPMRVLTAAVLLGVAAGLKASNAIFAVAATALVVVAVEPSQRWRSVLFFSAVGLLSGLSVAGYWYARVWQEFGNPIFPAANGMFRSDLFPSVNFTHSRFIPLDWLDALTRPLWMMSPEKMIYTDPPAPDARFIALFALLAITSATWFFRRSKAYRGPGSLLASFSWMFIACWILWLIVSGNGRYFMPMVMLCAPLAVALVYRISRNGRWLTYSLAGLVGVQITIAFLGAVPRYSVANWTGDWFNVDLPVRFKTEPVVVLSLGLESGAFLVPFLSRESSFVNVGGQYAMERGSPGWSRVERLIQDKDSRPVWLLATVDFTEQDGSPSRPRQLELDNAAARLGYRAEFEKCLDITLDGLPTSAVHIGTPSEAGQPIDVVNQDKKYYVICPAIRLLKVPQDFVERQADAATILDRAAASCPRHFRGPVPIVEAKGDAWWRFYMATDSMIWVDKQTVWYYRTGMYSPAIVGNVRNVLNGKTAVPCENFREALPVAAEPRPWYWGLAATAERIRNAMHN